MESTVSALVNYQHSFEKYQRKKLIGVLSCRVEEEVERRKHNNPCFSIGRLHLSCTSPFGASRLEFSVVKSMVFLQNWATLTLLPRIVFMSAG